MEGVKRQSYTSIKEGADIYVTMDMYGRNSVIPVEMAEEIKKVDGVAKAVPRVISRIYISGRLDVLLGIPMNEHPSVNFIKGSLPKDGEIVIGRGMADALKLDIGSRLNIGVKVMAIIDHSPYVIKKMYRISGIFDSFSIWASNLVLMNIDDAISIYEMDGFATDIAVYVKPGHGTSVIENLQKMNSFFRIQTKEIVEMYVERGFNTKGGIFVALYTVVFAVAIPALLVSSGIGLSERKKEIGILKATGWQTSEVMEMVFLRTSSLHS
jgi:ABC-type lipoprotein release transport system permease subunit